MSRILHPHLQSGAVKKFLHAQMHVVGDVAFDADGRCAGARAITAGPLEIVGAPPGRVSQDFERGIEFLHTEGGFRGVVVDVRMKALGQEPVGGADLGLGTPLVESQRRVVVRQIVHERKSVESPVRFEQPAARKAGDFCIFRAGTTRQCSPGRFMNKSAIVQAIFDTLREDFETRQRSSRQTRAAGNDAETKAEGKYDTRSTEENYLADGLARQAQEAALAAAAYENVAVRDFAADEPIDLGALVRVGFGDADDWFFSRSGRRRDRSRACRAERDRDHARIPAGRPVDGTHRGRETFRPADRGEGSFVGLLHASP